MTGRDRPQSALLGLQWKGQPSLLGEGGTTGRNVFGGVVIV